MKNYYNDYLKDDYYLKPVVEWIDSHETQISILIGIFILGLTIGFVIGTFIFKRL
jgi:hypothetical protein